MSRPEFPIGIVLPSNCISRIREEQEYYDRNPEEYERRKELRRKEQRIEDDRLAEYQQQQQEKIQQWEDEILITEPDKTIEDLPF